MKDRLLHILSTRRATLLIVLAALIARSLQLVFFYNIRVDASFQVMAMQNLVEGQGVSIPKLNEADWSQVLHQPLINWPPGYSLLLAPFYLLLGRNYLLAGIALDLAAALVLIFCSRAILRRLGVRLPWINLYTVLSSFTLYYFYFIASSDAVAISFVAAAMLVFLRMHEGPSGLAKTAGVALLLTCAAWIKYLFIPVVPVFPLLLLWWGYREGRRELRLAGGRLLILLGLSIGLLFLYQRSVSGTAGYVSAPERGFYPEHMADLYPFLPASFLQPATAGQIANVASENGTLLYRIYQVLHLLLLAGGTVWVGKRVFSKPGAMAAARFPVIVGLLSWAVFGVLLLLSLRVGKEEILPGLFWTYVEEPRYYGLATVALQWLLLTRLRCGSRLQTGIVWAAMLMWVIEAGRGMAFTANRLRLLGREEYSWQREDRFQRHADSLIRARNSTVTGVTGSTYFMNHRVSLYSHLPVLYAGELVNGPARCAQPVSLLVILRDADTARFRSFLATAPPAAGRWEDYRFYFARFEPNR